MVNTFWLFTINKFEVSFFNLSSISLLVFSLVILLLKSSYGRLQLLFLAFGFYSPSIGTDQAWVSEPKLVQSSSLFPKKIRNLTRRLSALFFSATVIYIRTRRIKTIVLTQTYMQKEKTASAPKIFSWLLLLLFSSSVGSWCSTLSLTLV
jgi:hypothetical protein